VTEKHLELNCTHQNSLTRPTVVRSPCRFLDVWEGFAPCDWNVVVARDLLTGCSAKWVGILFLTEWDRCLEERLLGGLGGGESLEIILRIVMVGVSSFVTHNCLYVQFQLYG